MGDRGWVLVVDDDEAIRETVSEVLTEEGYDVACAENGEQALEKLQTMNDLRVVLLDLMMPVMSGWEFLEVVQSSDRFRSIPVVVVSAMAAPGVEGHIQKPIDLERLLSTVEQFCCCKQRPSHAPQSA
jgi:two-component system, OmpR family, response regulator CpxR